MRKCILTVRMVIIIENVKINIVVVLINLTNIVKAICQHAGGKEDLDPRAYTKQQLQKTYWLDIFAINQHVSICHEPWLGCTCGREKYAAGHELCEVDKFVQVMLQMKQHAVAMAANLTIFRLVWVLLELHTAMMMGLLTQYCGVVSEKFLMRPFIPSVEDAKASVAEDKVRILNAIRRSPGGVAAFDAIISAYISELAALKAFKCFNERGLLPGCMNDVLSEVRRYPACINSCSSRGLGGTVMMMAAAHGDVEL